MALKNITPSTILFTSAAFLLLFTLLSPATSQGDGGYQGGGYQGGNGGYQGGGYQGGGSPGGGYQGGGYQGGGSPGGGYQGGGYQGGGYQGGGYQGGGGQGGNGGYQGQGYQGGEQRYPPPVPFVPILEPGKNETIVKLGQFAIGAYNTTMKGNLTYVDVLEAAARTGNDGTNYLLALQATEGILSRVFRADIFKLSNGWERLLYFKAVLA